MARTKKFLATSSRIKTTRSFYRPLKRLKSSSLEINAVNIQAPKKRIIPKAQILVTNNITEDADEYNYLHKIQHENSKNEYKNFVKEDSKRDEIPAISLDNNPPPITKSVSTPSNDVTETHIDDDLNSTSQDISQDLERLEKGMEKSARKDKEISQDIEEIREQFEKEKEKMEKTIHVLKKEIEHQQPINENKFFTISRELKSITEAMNQLLASDVLDANKTPILQPNITTDTSQQPIKPTLSEQVKLISGNQNTTIVNSQSNVSNKSDDASQGGDKKNNQEINIPLAETKSPADQGKNPIPADDSKSRNTSPKAKRKLPKPLLIIATTLLIMGLIGGFTWYSFNKKAEVNEQLVQQYLPSDAKTPIPTTQTQEEKKINESTNQNDNAENNKATPQVKGASDDKYAQSQADVPYSQTIWDTFKDPAIGIELNYPQNTVNVVKTESSLTFLRKNGYIFKIQIYETAFDIEEYWKSVKANNLNYNAKKTTFRDEPALFLELEDITEFPGDRYVVKRGDFVYDIWYATYSKNLADDDIKRIDIMLNSLKFLKQNE